MASIHLLGGKKRLLTIQVADLVHLQTLALWARLLKKNVRSTAAVLTSLGLLLFLFAHFHGVLNSGRVLQGDAGKPLQFVCSTAAEGIYVRERLHF